MGPSQPFPARRHGPKRLGRPIRDACSHLARQSGQPPARGTVLVRENAAGRVDIRYRDDVGIWRHPGDRRREDGDVSISLRRGPIAGEQQHGHGLHGYRATDGCRRSCCHRQLDCGLRLHAGHRVHISAALVSVLHVALRHVRSDILAWDVFFPFAMFFAAPAVTGSGLADWTRRLMMTSGVLASAGLGG